MSTLGFTLITTMESDWHIGSGQGRHRSIDRLVDRDMDDLPFLPSATLRGIWRDAAQTLARGLNNGAEGGTWAQLVDEVFGSEPALNVKCETAPIGSRMSLTDGLFPDGLRRHFVGPEPGRQVLRQALTFVKPGVSINRRSGRAKTDFLRFEEVVRTRAVLEAAGEIECPGNFGEKDRQTVAAFLVGAAALIERLGGKRRRGMGKCNVEVCFAEEFAKNGSEAAEILRDETSAPVFSAPSPGTETPHGFIPSGSDLQWTIFPLKLTLLSPLL